MKAVNKRNLTVIALVVFLVVLVLWRNNPAESVSVFQQQNESTAGNAVKAGQLAPESTLQGVGGKTYTIGGPKEKAVLLNFWASWCDPCKLEAPELNALAEKYKNSLDIYGINVTSHDYKPNAERFIKKYSLTFPVMFDLKGDVFAQYRGIAFPTNVLIDKNGVISEIVLGLLTPEELEEKIKAVTEP
ncbi:TlpA family protein disulfide reductase [Paenibacillus wynnii]|uniref:TlpA family protein disulfide reductase n=1 Tax=Paenibacillus wynnii TaxID=268407 RepID=UPI00278E0841|nr:TlpA disulfide reductase family protein [Paenibacillus wynnii]MDQ0195891.1 thiol-disulfide isomerase/thioredoxin [Paenibacillus wynnii]